MTRARAEDGCDFRRPTSAEVWDHAEEAHGVERDYRCLWDGCGLVLTTKQGQDRHEPVHTGIWPFSCPTCGKGYSCDSFAKICCVVMATCRCGATFKGKNGKRGLETHKKKCRPAVRAD